MMDTPLTGRLSRNPAAVVQQEVLGPQFAFELAHLLPHYLVAERVLLLEYRRMGLLSVREVADLADALDSVAPDCLRPEPERNLSDLAFALERHVLDQLAEPIPQWHVDRSRNDLQAAVQLRYVQQELLGAVDDALGLAAAAQDVAGGLLEVPLPGYTHQQAAQVISPGFYLAALAGEALAAAGRMLTAYDDISRCPLGAGALAGQQLEWDRNRMARLMGCPVSQEHALTAVASRGWAVTAVGELAAFAVTLSRFTTDLMAWGGDAHGLVELPDELAGISSAMPQKKNYPILERIRGRAGHVVSLAQDVAGILRSTPFTNSVEVSKEATASTYRAFTMHRSVVCLLAVVVRQARFRAGPARRACAAGHLGGMVLAHRLTLSQGVAWRTAQVIVGEYITAALAAGRTASRPDPELLRAAATGHGCQIDDPEILLREAFDPDQALRSYASAGSAHPQAVAGMLAGARERLAQLRAALAQRRDLVARGSAEIEELLAIERAAAGRPARAQTTAARVA